MLEMSKIWDFRGQQNTGHISVLSSLIAALPGQNTVGRSALLTFEDLFV